MKFNPFKKKKKEVQVLEKVDPERKKRWDMEIKIATKILMALK